MMSPARSSPLATCFEASRSRVALRDGLAFGFAQRVGLRLAAAFGHGFGEVGKQHREPEPERDLQIESESGAMVNAMLSISSTVVSTLPTSTTNITGFFTIQRGSSLRNESINAWRMIRVFQRLFFSATPA